MSDFESYCKTMVTIVRTAFNSYLDIFKKQSKEELVKYLIEREPDTSPICLKSLYNQGSWICNDCFKANNITICKECWSQIKDQHKDHNIKYLRNQIALCDCGDQNYMDKIHFCPMHNGITESNSDIKKYISDNLGENISSRIKSATEHLFKNMFDFYIRAINDKKTNSVDFNEVIDIFFQCFGILCENSKACRYLIAELMLKKYPIKLKHTCLDVNEESGKIVKSSFFSHECICPFIRFLMEYWPGDKVPLLYKLLKYYKLRKIMGLYYIFFYGDYTNNCIKDFDNIYKQLIFNDILKIACNIPGFIDKIYENMIDIIKTFFDITHSDSKLSYDLLELSDGKRYERLQLILENLQTITVNILKPVSFNYLANNTNIIFKLIDITALIHNVNKSCKSFFYFFSELVEVENRILDIFSYFVTIFNFGDDNLVKEVFVYFSKAILKKLKIN